MSKEIQSKLGSTIYDRMNTIKMNPGERYRALDAMHNADLLVDGFMWVVKKIEHLGSFSFQKPQLKH